MGHIYPSRIANIVYNILVVFRMDKKRLKVSDVLDCFDQWEEENDSNSSELDDSFLDQNYEPDLGRNRDFEDTFSDTSDNKISDDESSDEENCEEVKNDNETKTTSTNKDTEPDKAIFSWTNKLQNYVPRMSLPSET